MVPSKYPEVQGRPHLQSLLSTHIDMQFEDVRALLRLPRAGSTVGANFAAAALLFNLISGISVVLYNASWKGFAAKSGSGAKFKKVLLSHFPFTEIPIQKELVVGAFYTYSRNPLAHSLGLGVPSHPKISIAKKPLTPSEITELEDNLSLPEWSHPALSPIGIQPGSSYQLCISGLYWGIHRMLHSIFADGNQVRDADQLAKRLGF